MPFYEWDGRWDGWDVGGFVKDVVQPSRPNSLYNLGSKLQGLDANSTQAEKASAAGGGLVGGAPRVVNFASPLFKWTASAGDDVARSTSSWWDNLAGAAKKPSVQKGAGLAVVGGGAGVGLWGAGLGLESALGNLGDAGRNVGEDVAAAAKSLLVPAAIVLIGVLLLRRK